MPRSSGGMSPNMSAILYVHALESTELVHARHSDPERTDYPVWWL